MKAFILTESDFDRLVLAIERHPDHGRPGHVSSEQDAHDREAFRFFNYQVRNWIAEVQR
jgi:hypothetical protein